jgi:hypothetical protein
MASTMSVHGDALMPTVFLSNIISNEKSDPSLHIIGHTMTSCVLYPVDWHCCPSRYEWVIRHVSDYDNQMGSDHRQANP